MTTPHFVNRETLKKSTTRRVLTFLRMKNKRTLKKSQRPIGFFENNNDIPIRGSSRTDSERN